MNKSSIPPVINTYFYDYMFLWTQENIYTSIANMSLLYFI